MKKRLLFILPAVAVLWGVLCFPDWFKDPKEWALGDWENPTHKLYVSVAPEAASWENGGRRGRVLYQWVQAEEEPYRLTIRQGNRTISATLRFEGKDTAILEPLLSEHLDDTARSYLHEYNRLRNRPADEIKLLFQRKKKQ